MVRFQAAMQRSVMLGPSCFNSPMVRFQAMSRRTTSTRTAVSIPQWSDFKHSFCFAIKSPTLRFQFPNGPISSRVRVVGNSYNPGFNSPMVRFQVVCLRPRSAWPAGFQFPNGPISREKRNTDLPMLPRFNSPMVRFQDKQSSFCSAPLWFQFPNGPISSGVDAQGNELLSGFQFPNGPISRPSNIPSF